MSLSIMQAKPEEFGAPERRASYTVSIIGCGRTGILQTCLFAEAGFKVVCVDADQTIVNSVARGKTSVLGSEAEVKLKSRVKSGRVSATNDVGKAVSQSDVIALAVPVKIDAKRKPDYSAIEKTCKQIGSNLRRGSLVIVTCLTGIGVTEGLVKETLENASGFKVGIDFGLAYSPFELFQEQTSESVTRQQRVMAAVDAGSSAISFAVLKSIAKGGLRKVETTRMAEAAVLFEVLRRDVGVALANELAFFCERVSLDYLEAQRFFRGEPDNLPLLPVLTGASNQDVLSLLAEDAESLGVKLRISTAARETNEEIAKHAINLAKDALKSCGKPLRRARISLLGISQTPNAKGSLKKTAREVAKMLEAKGARVSFYDPYLSENELSEVQGHFRRSLTEVVEGADCIMILTGHDQFRRLGLNRLKVLAKMPAAIVDLEGIVEPGKAEKEGFIYRGLGRGVWTK